MFVNIEGDEPKKQIKCFKSVDIFCNLTDDQLINDIPRVKQCTQFEVSAKLSSQETKQFRKDILK